LHFIIAITGKMAKFVFGRQEGFSANSDLKLLNPEIQNGFKKSEAGF
jgi:hypothetical protein